MHGQRTYVEGVAHCIEQAELLVLTVVGDALILQEGYVVNVSLDVVSDFLFEFKVMIGVKVRVKVLCFVS